MLHYPDINPIAIAAGPIKIHWYGIMYLIGFLGAWGLGLWRAKAPYTALNKSQVGDAIFYGALGVLIGGRVGYMLLYNFTYFIQQPWSLFQIWDGGMSFHGGLIGVFVSTLLYARKIQVNVWDILDFFAPMVPVGLGAGRIGNFINGELWGRVTDASVGMVFPTGGPLPRYPSQLAEFLLEGVLLFIILWVISRKPRPRFAMCALFITFYGIFRFIIEFLRQPDPQLGYVMFGWMTQGQVLSLPMVIGGIAALLVISRQSNKRYNPNASHYLTNLSNETVSRPS